jgi:type II secretory pathway component PulK
MQAMLGLDDVQAQAVLERRDGADGIAGTEDDMPFRSADEFFATVGNMDAATRQAVQGSVTVNSSFFTVRSTGEVGGVKHTILATLRRDGDTIQIVMWRELREGS